MGKLLLISDMTVDEKLLFSSDATVDKNYCSVVIWQLIRLLFCGDMAIDKTIVL